MMNMLCRHLTLNGGDSIRMALETIDKQASRVALVINGRDELLGVVTDGDIRRGILKGIALSQPVRKIMNPEPIVFSCEEKRDNIKSRLEQEKLLHAPLVDHSNKLVDLVTLQDLVNKPKIDNGVFLMAGGFGKRLMPLTKDCPKPLLRIGNKPLLETTIESMIAAGFHRFFISTHYLSDMVKDYFGDGSQWNVSIQYIHETEPLGTAGALGLLNEHDNQHLPMIVMNGDILTKVDFEQLLNYHNAQEQALATICVRQCQFEVPYGVIDTDGEKIVSMKEKPVNSYLVNAGIYVVTQALIAKVQSNTAIDMPTLLSHQLRNNETIAMFPIHEYWLDIGKNDDFRRAQLEFKEIFSTSCV